MKKFFCTVNLLLGAALALTPFLLYPVCEQAAMHGGHMKCWYSAVLITVCGCLLCACALFGLLRGGRGAFAVVLLGVCCAALCWLVPDGVLPLGPLGWCGAAEHACRQLTRPAALKIAAALALCDMGGLVALFVKAGR